MKTWMSALALASALMAVPATAQDAHTMTVGEFRLRSEQARTYMVLGAVAFTGKMDIVCPVPVSVGEWTAALMYRPFDVKRPWIEVLLELMDERGCGAREKKADT